MACTMIHGAVQEVTAGKGAICRDILEDLPEWFGIAEARQHYVETVEALPMCGFAVEGHVVGFLSIKQHNRFTAEAYVLGVKRNWHRNGIGRALFDRAERDLCRRGLKYLTVKTLAADRPNRSYEATRYFYDALGFVPVEVFPALWGSDNPCLLMIKALAKATLAKPD
jgi:ribosomal protein S18 acetylase RimI-like enzyme